MTGERTQILRFAQNDKKALGMTGVMGNGLGENRYGRG